MLIEQTNPSQVILEVYVLNPDGSVKTDIVTANVRVYHVDGTGSEVTDLASTPMTQVGATNVWRYKWVPISLAPNSYLVEYTLVDSMSLTTVSGEDLVVGYLESKIDTITTIVELIKQVQIGRWKITPDNKLTLYKEDNTTVIVAFNLYDITGVPTTDAVADRIKI